MANPQRVLILGGGYVAINAVKALRPAARRGEVEITVVDRNNFHTFHGLVPEMLVGKIQAGQVVSAARRLFDPGRFLTAKVDFVDLETKTVQISRILDGQPHTLHYDHLVVCLGSEDDLGRYRGVGEHTMRLKSYLDCVQVRNHVLAMLEMAELEDDETERRRLLHFVVAGGNYAGIEVASELVTFAKKLARTEYHNIEPDEVSVSVVHSREHILPELGERFPKLALRAEKTLRDLGVTLELGVKLASATPLEAILSDGRRLPSRTIISCTGTAQSPVLSELPYERDRGGRLIADAFGCVDAEAKVWSGGDCGAIPLKNGGTAPALAIYAMEAGKTIGKNIARSIRGQKLKRYNFTGFGDCCALGYGKAVGQVWGVPLWGFPAWVVWRVCMIVYLPSWLKRVRTLLDWMTTPFLGRDIISVGSPDEVGVQPELFEDGQVVVRQGDVGRAMFIVRSGTVKVVRELPDGESEHLADLGPGDHFGEIAVLRDVRRTATVRAVGSVELLRVSRAGTRMLASSFDAFDKVSSTAQARHEAAPAE